MVGLWNLCIFPGGNVIFSGSVVNRLKLFACRVPSSFLSIWVLLGKAQQVNTSCGCRLPGMMPNFQRMLSVDCTTRQTTFVTCWRGLSGDGCLCHATLPRRNPVTAIVVTFVSAKLTPQSWLYSLIKLLPSDAFGRCLHPCESGSSQSHQSGSSWSNTDPTQHPCWRGRYHQLKTVQVGKLQLW